MSLASEYLRQSAWRDRKPVLAALPELHGRTVLDLGCGVGDVAAELTARGARVIGLDINPDLLRVARERNLPGAEFREADLRALPELGVRADGIWCSFAAAYLPDLASHLPGWSERLRPGGWIALTEVDDLFGHEPLSAHARALLRAYEAEALAAGRYDFHMGRKLAHHVVRAGFEVVVQLALTDRELSFPGAAAPDVLDAWRMRLQRMRLLREFCGSEMEQVEQAFLGCLESSDHRSLATVHCCIAVKPHLAVRPLSS